MTFEVLRTVVADTFTMVVTWGRLERVAPTMDDAPPRPAPCVPDADMSVAAVPAPSIAAVAAAPATTDAFVSIAAFLALTPDSTVLCLTLSSLTGVCDRDG